VSFSNDLYEYSLLSPAVELVVKDVLPRSEVQLSVSDCYHNLTAHDLPLMVGIGVILACAVVVVTVWRGIEGSQFLEPLVVVAMQARLVVVDEYARRYVHRVYEHKAVLNAAFRDRFLDVSMDRNDGPPLRNIHP